MAATHFAAIGPVAATYFAAIGTVAATDFAAIVLVGGSIHLPVVAVVAGGERKHLHPSTATYPMRLGNPKAKQFLLVNQQISCWLAIRFDYVGANTNGK